MAKPNLALFSLAIFFLVLSSGFTVESAETRTRSRPRSYPNDFIRSSCRATRYPTLCVHCLSGYAAAIKQSDRHLAQTALLVSLSRARSAASFVAKLAHARGIRVRDYRAVKDCVENMGDSVDRLGQSLRELGQTGPGGEFAWHMSNVQTWVSAALTDENTCMDGFASRAMDGVVKAAVRRRVVGLAQVTSNALALVNRFASRHQAAAKAP